MTNAPVHRPILFLDLDDTVRYSKSRKRFIQGPDDVAVYPDVVPVLRAKKSEGYGIVGTTNQAGVAYGFKTEQDVQEENNRTNKLLFGLFDVIYCCIAHPEGTEPFYRRRSLLRKPDIGMIVITEIDLDRQGMALDYSRSLLVGDRPEDEQCARNAGIEFKWAWDFFNRKS